MCRWRGGGEKGKYSFGKSETPDAGKGDVDCRKWGGGGYRAANGYIWGAVAWAVGHARYLRKESLCIFYIFLFYIGQSISS